MRVTVLYALVAVAFLLVTVSAQTALTTRVRLVNTNQKKTEGRLEVQYGNQWWAVCNTGTQIKDLGNWACKQLGIGTLKNVADYGRAPTGTNAIVKIACSSSATVDSCVRGSDVSSTCAQGGIVCSATECVVTDFGAWSDCSAPCGGGTQERTRTVSQAPTDGLTCPELLGRQACNTDPCPVDCVMSDWTDWSNCTKPCRGGIQRRTRSVLTGPANGGAICSSEVEKIQGCNTQECGQACAVSDWGVWSECDRVCDGGSKYRTRVVISEATFGGAPCPITNQTYPCNIQACPIDCIVSDWSAWGTCSVDCGGGNWTQTRHVTNQPAYGGTPCPELFRSEACNTHLCAIDCEMEEWSAWSACTKQCGTGSITRTRGVKSREANGGLPCGDILEKDPCNTARCPEDRAAILVDRIRKLELQDRINTLEELQAKQAAELAAAQTADLLSQVGGGGGGGSTGGANPSFLEMLVNYYESRQRQIQATAPSSSPSPRLQQKMANLESLKSSINQAKAELRRLQQKDNDVTVVADASASVSSTESTSDSSDQDEDEITDEVDAQGHHHKKHHHHKRHNNNDTPNSDSKFSQTAPAQLDPVPPLFAHTVAIPAGNNNDLLSTKESSKSGKR